MRQTAGGLWYLEGDTSELRALALTTGQNIRVIVAGVLPVAGTPSVATLMAQGATSSNFIIRTDTSGVDHWRAPPRATSGAASDFAADGVCRVDGVAGTQFVRGTAHVLTRTRGTAGVATVMASIFRDAFDARVWEGGLFTLFGRDTDLTADEMANMEQWTADKCGVTL